MLFLQRPANPDLLYIILFVHSQLTTTVVLCLLFGSKMYMTFKGIDSKNLENMPSTGLAATRAGSRYLAPRSPGTQLSHMPLTSSTSQDRNSDPSTDGMEEPKMEHEIQAEFRRLYMQLETLKCKNMKMGNRHLSHKLSAMTEAALSSEPPSEHATPTMNNKRKVVINLHSEVRNNVGDTWHCSDQDDQL